MSAAAITNGLPKCSSIQSSSGMPTPAAGTHATTIFAHIPHVERRSSGVLRLENGLSWLKNSTHTARMAPSWITTKNMSQKSGLTSSFTNWSSNNMWPVDEMGSHSVMPSTSPYRAALNSSFSSI